MTNAEQKQPEDGKIVQSDSATDSKRKQSSSINQASKDRCDEEASQQTQPPARQARPLRPNQIRRKALLVAAGSSIGAMGKARAGGVVPPPVCLPGTDKPGATIELASVPAFPMPNMLPPKRPAHLPARYEGTYTRSPMSNGARIAGVSAASKPNRYLWAHWPPPVQVTTGGGHPVGVSGQTGGDQARHLGAGGHVHSHHGFHHHFAAPFSSAASRVMVVNPMQIVNLSEHTKSHLIKFIEAIKRFSEKWFSHVLLLMFLAVYACLGAYIFISFEAPNEQWEKQLIIDSRQKMVNDSYNEAKLKNREQFNELFISKLEDYERLLSRACASGMSSSSLENQWTFWGALFYSMTVFTTIGYGHLTPITFAGRVATMIYAIFGIPILLMVLADLGKLLTRIIKYAFKKFRYLFNKLLRKKSSLKTRKLISDNTNQYIGVARDAFERGYAYIQVPYNRLPGSLRENALTRKFRKRTPIKEQVEVDNNIDSIATGGDIVTAGDQQQFENSEQIKAQAAQQDLIEPTASDVKAQIKSTSEDDTLTDVILTPIKQTKPVSPQLSNEKRPHQANDNGHSNHHHHHHHSPSNHHNHHSGHTNRGQSPGGQARRKTSATISTGTLSRKGATSKGGSVSRSSSSSQMVIGATGGLEKRSKLIGQRSGDLAGKLAEQPDEGPKTPPPEASGAISTSAEKRKSLGNVDLETGIGDTEFISGDEELEEDVVDEEDSNTGEDDEEDEFDIPVSFALFLLVTYMMFGAVVFSIWEGWNFFDSLYFVFISMSTIGFGDLVPQHPKRMIGTFIYLLFGLALTSMCINVVQEKIHATFLRAKMQIGEKMGLDLEQIMADDYYNDGSIGTEGDEDDSNSVAVSQTNSSLAHGFGGDLLEQGAVECQQLGKLASLEGSVAGAEGVKMSKSKDSLKSINKRRTLAGLPGHNSHNNSLRRKPSKRNPVQRQSTPTGVSLLSSPSSEQAPSAALLAASVVGPQATLNSIAQDNTTRPNVAANKPAQRAQFEIVHKTEQLIGINHPIDESAKGICEPLKGIGLKGQVDICDRQQVNGERDKLSPGGRGAASQSGHCAVAKSLSNDSRFNQVNQKRARLGAIARSADSSRRSSVSFELNQLDDLIVALSHSPSERYGPLLGVPSSARSSCSSSPSTSLARRGTSMINKPSSNHFDRSTMVSPKKKSSILTHTSPAAALLKLNPKPTINLTDSQRALDEDLGTIKFSAV